MILNAHEYYERHGGGRPLRFSSAAERGEAEMRARMQRAVDAVLRRNEQQDDQPEPDRCDRPGR